MSGWPPTLPFASSGAISYELWVKPAAGLDPATRYGLLHLDDTANAASFEGVTLLDGHVRWGDVVSDNTLIPRVWNHVACTVTNSETARGEVWVNGTPTIGTFDGTNMWGSSTSVLRIGGGESTSVTVLDGQIAEPAVYSYALSSRQILEHYRVGSGATQAQQFSVIGFAASPYQGVLPSTLDAAAAFPTIGAVGEIVVVDPPSAGTSATFAEPSFGVGTSMPPQEPTLGFGDETVAIGSSPSAIEPNAGFGDSAIFVGPNLEPLEPSVAFPTKDIYANMVPTGVGMDAGFNVPDVLSTPMISNDYIVVLRYDFDGTNFVVPNVIDAVLVDAYNIEMRADKDNTDTLAFSYPADGPNVDAIKHDAIIELVRRRYRVSKITDGRTSEGAKFFDIECMSLATDLGTTLPNAIGFQKVWITLYEEETPAGPVKYEPPEHPAEESIITAATMLEGVEAILNWGSQRGWRPGTIEVNPLKPNQTYSMAARGESVLESLRTWAQITGTVLKIDTISRTVNLLQPVTTPVPFRLEYAKNILEIRREMQHPQTTRLWPYGRNGLSILATTGKYYIENYSWYMTAYGISEEEARINFLKDGIWETDDYIEAANLKDAAVKKLEELSQPTISYEVTVASIPEIGVPFVDVQLGDIVIVRDTDLGIDIQTEVVGLARFFNEPWRDEIELSYLKPGLGNNDKDTSSADVNNLGGGVLFLGNSAQKVVNSTSDTDFGSLSITAFASGPVTVGYTILGTANIECEIKLEFSYAGNLAFPAIYQQLQAGKNNISGTFCITSIQEGSEFFQAKARLVNNPSAQVTIEENQFNMYVYGQRIAGGTNAANARVNVSDSVANKTLPAISENINATKQTPLPLGPSDAVAVEPAPQHIDQPSFALQVQAEEVVPVLTFASVTVTTT